MKKTKTHGTSFSSITFWWMIWDLGELEKLDFTFTRFTMHSINGVSMEFHNAVLLLLGRFMGKRNDVAQSENKILPNTTQWKVEIVWLLLYSKKRLIKRCVKSWYYPSSQWWGWLCKRMWKDYFLSICHFRVWYCCANIGLLVSHWSQIKLGIVLLPYQLAKQSSLLIDLLSGTNETVVSM